jgi:hypothetical protein
MDFQEVRWGGMDWIDLALDTGQVMGTYECGTERPGSINRVEFHD